MLRRVHVKSKQFLTGTALPFASSAVVSAVNPRFFRFRKPLQLAIGVGFLVLLLTAGICAAIYFIDCRVVTDLVPLSEISKRSSTPQYKDKCQVATIPNFFISSKVESSRGLFGMTSDSLPAVLQPSTFNWTAQALLSVAFNNTSGLDTTMDSFKPATEYSTMSEFELRLPVPELPGGQSTGEMVTWQVKMLNSTTLDGAIPTPSDCPYQWKIMINSPPVGVKVKRNGTADMDMILSVNSTLNWTCVGYTWLFAEVAQALADPQEAAGNLTLGLQPAINATFNTPRRGTPWVLLAELEEAVRGMWFPPIEWCMALSDPQKGDAGSSSWCATITYDALLQESRRHTRAVSTWHPQMKLWDGQARKAIYEWAEKIPRRTGGPGYIISTSLDLNRLRNALMTLWGHCTGLMALMTRSQFEREFQASLQLNVAVCRPRVCPSVIAVVGAALGYAGVLEIAAAFVVLIIYLARNADERPSMQKLNEIVFEGHPEEEIEADKQHAERVAEAAESRNGTNGKHAANGEHTWQ